MKGVILALTVLMYALVIAFQGKKVIFTTGAALIAIALAAIFPGDVFTLPAGVVAGSLASRVYAVVHSLRDLVNWNVLMIYLGSMTIASLFIYSKAPARIANLIVNGSANSAAALVAILAMTGIISIFVENVATVLVMAPIGLALCSSLKMNPTFFMIGLAVMSNLEGTATLVGDPPSMIFAAFSGYGFNDFFVHQGRLSIFFVVQTGMIAGCVFFWFFFASHRKNKVSVASEKVISWLPFAFLLAMIVGLAAISFARISFGYASGTLTLALGIASLVWYKVCQRKRADEVWQVVRELDWETIFFLLGIFVVVGAIREVGLLDDLACYLSEVTGGGKLAGFAVILAVSVVISGFVDNVPYIIAMLPVASSMAGQADVRGELFMFALLVGSCLGGNLTPFGASANVVAMGILKKQGYPMRFSGWLKTGVPFTLVTTAAAALVLWLLWS